MTKKITAVLATLTMIISLAACGSKTSNETTTAEDTISEVVTEEADTTEEATEATETEDTDKSEEATEAEDKTAKDETEKEDESSTEAEKEEETAQAKPQSKEEIVAYFNTAVNKVKTDAKSVTSPYAKISLAGNMTLPSSLNGILKILGGADEFIGGQLEKNSRTTSETYTGADIKAKFPVEGESYSSKLTAADVKSATCTEKDGKYTITITTVADGKSSNVQHGQGHAPKAFNVVLPGVVNDNIPGVATSIVGTASMNYPSSTVKIVVDAKTGNVISAIYDLYWTINFDKAGVVIPFLTSTAYNVNF